MNDHEHKRGEPELVQIGPLPGASPPPRQWRSLEELDGLPIHAQTAHDEFPAGVTEWTDPASRRQFLRIMGASAALAGASGCTYQDQEKIVPYVRSPEEVVPGKPLFFATAAPLGGYGLGVLAESHMGRPTKIEGNPDHPASRGATDIFAQAEPLALYDPDRSQVVLHNGRVSTWDDFITTLIPIREAKLQAKGAGLRILTETVTSPTLARQLDELRKRFPEAKWHSFEPIGRANAKAGAQLAFGEDVACRHHFEQADVILSLDADFLAWGPARVLDARDYAARRETLDGRGMNRLYVAEPTPSITGAMAEHRLPVPAHRIATLARAIAAAVGVPGSGIRQNSGTDHSDAESKWIAAVVADLKVHRGTSLVLAGEPQPPEVHALAHAMNDALGNVGKTVDYLEPIEKAGAESLAELAAAIRRNEVDTLIILGGNPAYAAAADLDFAALLTKVPFSVHLSLREDETSVAAAWHLPETHFLETWGDVRAFDGTVTIQQPLIGSLHGGRSAIELLDLVLNGSSRSGLEILREQWRRDRSPAEFDAWWRRTLRAGTVADSAAEPRKVTPKQLDLPAQTNPTAPVGLEVVFRPDPTVWDGRYANNGWLQELPKPLTRFTWENPVLIAPRTAQRLGLRTRIGEHGESDMIELKQDGRILRLPIWIMPGQPEDSLTVMLGYGRTNAGRVGTGRGWNAYSIRTGAAPWFASGVTVTPTHEEHLVPTVQRHYNMENRELVRAATIGTYQAKPKLFQEEDEHLTRDLTLYPDPPAQERHEQGVGNAWGMAINLNTCIGCGACVVACQAENNIPVVGADEVLRGREMHWIRVDRYFEGDPANPTIHSQPVPCMHCEKAPCELVCPVGATTHSPEGLNEMTYNRCVGTRYCSNNCPYKVRRFNFYHYTADAPPVHEMLQNPDVTVRWRGVMEKCTYCVQRINGARIAAEIAGRDRVGGNDVETACQSACPTRAIVFGNLNDRDADVVKAKADPRNYALLAELNTRPRTTYLAKLTNPNPNLTPEPPHGH